MIFNLMCESEYAAITLVKSGAHKRESNRVLFFLFYLDYVAEVPHSNVAADVVSHN